jgi:hypothetical protein
MHLNTYIFLENMQNSLLPTPSSYKVYEGIHGIKTNGKKRTYVFRVGAKQSNILKIIGLLKDSFSSTSTKFVQHRMLE